RHGISEHLNASRPDVCIGSTNSFSVRTNIEGNVHVKKLVHASVAVHIPCVSKHKVLNEPLFKVHPPVLEIDCSRQTVDVDPLLRRVDRGRDIATSILVRLLAIAVDGESLHRQNPLFSSQGVGGACDELQFRRLSKCVYGGTKENEQKKFLHRNHFPGLFLWAFFRPVFFPAAVQNSQHSVIPFLACVLINSSSTLSPRDRNFPWPGPGCRVIECDL